MKNLFQKNSLIIILVFLSLRQVLAQELPELRFEKIKEDFLREDINVPNRYIEKHRITIFYSTDLAVVHLKYKETQEAFMPCSYVAIYKWKGSAWDFKKSMPFNYEMEMVDRSLLIFLSNNEFCNMTGVCSYYSQISQLDNLEMKELVAFNGFDHSVNYLLRVLDEGENPKKLVGDTVVKNEVIRNVRAKNRRIVFDLEKETAVFKGIIKDSLVYDRKKIVVKDVVISF